MTSSELATYKANWERAGLEYGVCLCRCGQRTAISPTTKRKDGRLQRVAGEPQRFLFGHQMRGRPSEKRKWSADLIVQRVRQWHEETGRPPTSQDWSRSTVLNGVNYPATSLVIRHCGSWRAALVHAGFPPNKRPDGSGSLQVRLGRGGHEVWIGEWTSPSGEHKGRRLGARTGPKPISRMVAEQKLAALIERDKARVQDAQRRAVPGPQSPPSVDKMYSHLRRAQSEADRLDRELSGDERLALRQTMHHLGEAEDWLMRAMGRC